jgi:molybdate transport system regulatory protein
MKLSARNVLAGTITKVTKGAVNSEVELTLTGGEKVIAGITNGSVEALGLKDGKNAYAIVKASWVILGTDLHNAKISARNILCGTVTKIQEGAVNGEVALKLGGRAALTAIVTNESIRSLGLKDGGHACAAFKASSVIIGTE